MSLARVVATAVRIEGGSTIAVARGYQVSRRGCTLTDSGGCGAGTKTSFLLTDDQASGLGVELMPVVVAALARRSSGDP